MSYVGKGDSAAHDAAGLVLDFHASMATSTGPGINSPATSVWKDLSGKGNHGTLVSFGYTAASGWLGDGTSGNPSSLQMDGTSDYVDCGMASSLNIVNEVTVELWIRGITTTTNTVLLSKSYATGYYINISNGRISFWTGNTSISANDQTVINDGGLYHIVGIKKTDNTKELYINNKLVGTGTGTLLDNLSNPVWIGSNKWSGFSKAQYHAIRIYNRALTTTEITQNYNAGILWGDEGGGGQPTNATVNATISAVNSTAIIPSVTISPTIVTDISVVSIVATSTTGFSSPLIVIRKDVSVNAVSSTVSTSLPIPSINTIRSPTINASLAVSSCMATQPTTNVIRNSIVNVTFGSSLFIANIATVNVTRNPEIKTIEATALIIANTPNISTIQSPTIDATVIASLSLTNSPNVDVIRNLTINTLVTTSSIVANAPAISVSRNPIITAIFAISTNSSIVPAIQVTRNAIIESAVATISAAMQLPILSTTGIILINALPAIASSIALLPLIVTNKNTSIVSVTIAASSNAQEPAIAISPIVDSPVGSLKSLFVPPTVEINTSINAVVAVSTAQLLPSQEVHQSLFVNAPCINSMTQANLPQLVTQREVIVRPTNLQLQAIATALSPKIVILKILNATSSIIERQTRVSILEKRCRLSILERPTELSIEVILTKSGVID